MFNFRKIASVLASTVMVGSTVALAAASTFPAPFVENGSANVAIVYGQNAPLDLALVADITSSLNTQLGRQAASGSSGSSTITGGDFVKLQRGSDKFNLGDAANSFYTTLDEEEFAKVLAKGNYLNDNNDDYDYEQSMNLGGLTLTHFLDSSFNDEKPIIGFNLNSGDAVLNYTLKFTPDAAAGGAALAYLDNTEIEMLGRKFFISNAEITANGVKLTLLDSANTMMLAEGETKTVQVGNRSYEVAINFVDSTKSKLTINGETTNSISEGQTFKLKDGTYVGIKDIMYNSKDSGISKVEFSLGSGQIVLENGVEVKLNNEDISTFEDANGYASVVNAYITNTSTDINQIKLEWLLDDDAWVAPGTDLVMPGFNTIKLSIGGFTAPEKEVTTIKDSSDALEVKTTVKDGSLTLPILYANSSTTGFDGLGKKANEQLVTNASSSPRIQLNESAGDRFVATWISGSGNGDEYESYAFELGSITNNDGKNSTKLTNLASGGSDVSFSEVGDSEDVGQLRLTLSAADYRAKTATITVATAGSGVAYTDRLVTKAGLQMRLPISSVESGPSNLNFTAGDPTTFNMIFYEEDKDGNVASGAQFNITAGLRSEDGTQPTAVNGVTTYDSEDGSDLKIGYKVSDLATQVKFNNPSNALKDIEITYAGEQSTADVFLSEVSASVSSNSTVSLGSLSVSDADVASVASKNLIVVGGSCVNTVAAELLGVPAGTCGAAFTAKTGIAANQALIQTFARNGKVATLVAGFNAPDTAMAAKYLTTQSTDTTVGQKLTVTSETQASVSTA